MANGRPGRPKGTPKTGGRKKGEPNKATLDIKAMCREHGPAAVAKLLELMDNADSDSVKLGASREILDRAYGRATQAVSLDDDGDTLGKIAKVIHEIVG